MHSDNKHTRYYMEEGLDPKLEAEASRPKKTWFVKRLFDGKVLPMEEKATWEILNDTANPWRRQGFEILGCSDGTTYQKVFKENASKVRELEVEAKAVMEELQRYGKTRENLKFTELLDDHDPKMVRVDSLIKEKQEEYNKLNDQIKELRKNAVQLAFDAELEEAKKNPNERPRNLDILTPKGRRGEILDLMGRK